MSIVVVVVVDATAAVAQAKSCLSSFCANEKQENQREKRMKNETRNERTVARFEAPQ